MLKRYFRLGKSIAVAALFYASGSHAGECLVMGDSIALGTAKHAPQCMALAKVGIGSGGWLQRYGQYLAQMQQLDTVVISLGSNDADELKSVKSLLNVRGAISAKKVVWIAPSEKFLAKPSVSLVAKQFNDTLIARPEKFRASDGVHLTSQGYKIIAQTALH
jgi:lysophospholipase L1-like esterase